MNDIIDMNDNTPRFSPPRTRDPLDIEISPGFQVRDIKTAEECVTITLRLEEERRSIISQLDRRPEDPEGNPGWRNRAQKAIAWKKKAIDAIKLYRDVLIVREAHAEPQVEVEVEAETPDPLDAVVTGFVVPVRSLPDVAACDAACLRLESERDAILAQFPKQEQNPLLFGRGWRTKAQLAIAWKKRVMAAVRERKKKITEGSPTSSERKESRRAALLDVIHDDIGNERMEAYITKVKALRPDLFTVQEDAP